MFSIGFIDYFIDEWHANNYPKWIEAASGGDMRVTHVYAMIDSPKGGRSTAEWCCDAGVIKCDTIGEVIENCDGLIVLSPDNAEMHEQLCAEPLKSGKPVYVDKVFAPDLAAAKRMFEAARAGGTPMYTTSALRCAEEFAQLKGRDIRAVCSWGPGEFGTYAIHQLEPITMLIDSAAKRVTAYPAQGGMNLSIEFEDGRWATVSCFSQGAPFAMNLLIPGGNRALTVESDFFMPFIKELTEFFRDRRPRVAEDQTLRVIALIEAGKKALNAPYTWVSL